MPLRPPSLQYGVYVDETVVVETGVDKLGVVCRVGEHQHRLAHRCSPCNNFAHKHNGDMGMGHLMGGAFMI